MKEKIEKTNRYIAEKRDQVNPLYRGHFHLMPPIGWMNDPNGFVFYKGDYHLFYQFYPYDSVWGPMHWGHAKSKDLLHWEELPVALAPSEPYDQNGCFSGSALVKDDRLVLLYTGHVENDQERLETQCMASSEDGLVFEKYAHNPVISQKQIEGIADSADFRDPKIFEHEGRYYAVVASKTPDERGQILLFESADCLNWRFKSVLLEGEKGQGLMWECPDLFELDGKWVLILSPIEMERQQEQFWNINSSLAFIGQMDWETGHFQVENEHEIDGGLDFYAPQTCVNDQGERYLVAWMQMWHRTIPPHELGHGWSGMMTLPRRLSVRHKRLCQEIPDSLFQQLSLQEDGSGQVTGLGLILSDLARQQQYLRLEVEPNADFELLYAHNPVSHQAVQLSYSPQTRLLSLSREGLGYPIKGQENPYSDTRYIRLEAHEGPLVLELVRDTNSIEIFVKGKTMSMTFYEQAVGTDIILRSDLGLTVNRFEIYEIQKG